MSPSPTASIVTLAFLAELAKQSAADGGDLNVRSAEAVLTTEIGASKAMGLGQAPETAVYLIQVTGHFILKDVSIPPGGQFPTGDYDVLEVDAATGQPLGAGLDTGDAKLASMGKVITLSW
jgi:hypothetical protein